MPLFRRNGFQSVLWVLTQHSQQPQLSPADVFDIPDFVLAISIMDRIFKVIAGKQAINILQLQSLGLREEQVDDGHPRGVQNRKDDVSAPSNTRDGDWSNLNHHLSSW